MSRILSKVSVTEITSYSNLSFGVTFVSRGQTFVPRKYLKYLPLLKDRNIFSGSGSPVLILSTLLGPLSPFHASMADYHTGVDKVSV